MVLLTSSSISVAISSGIIFLFTFLLFISGYVVQQQTVRSLQAALHPPPMPTPTLPVYFQEVNESSQTGAATIAEVVDTPEAQASGNTLPSVKAEGFQTIATTVATANPTAWIAEQMVLPSVAQPLPFATRPPAGDLADQVQIDVEKIAPAEEIQNPTPKSNSEKAAEPSSRLAYVQLLSNPSQICSALLFFKLQMDHGETSINRVIIYPSIWEEDTTSDPFTTVLALMRLTQDEYKITYRSVKVDDPFEQRAIERGLVTYLATSDWEFDRMLYLRSPGLALNVAALDSALQASKTTTSLSRNWAPSNPQPSTGPAILLVADQAIHTPRGSNRRLTAEAFTSHANHHENEMDVEAAAQTAAYVHFDEGELEHRRTEKEWYGGVFERYERGRAEICKGISFEGGRTELKKARKRGW